MKKRSGYKAMAGRFPSSDREKVIRSWMLSTAANEEAIEQHRDLHIDRIDPAWRDKREWLPDGINALGIALNVRKQENLRISVVLAISLRATHKRVGVNFKTVQELDRQLDNSPPSLYLFHEGKEPWSKYMLNGKNCRVEELNPMLFRLLSLQRRFIYMEFESADHDVYYRSILVH